jgi:hypothetical protein
MSISYQVTLSDPTNAGGSNDATLVYDLQQALGVWSQYISGAGTLVVNLVIANTSTGRASGAPTSNSLIGTAANGFSIYESSTEYELATGKHVSGTTSDITVTVSPAYFQNLDLSFGLSYGSQVPSNEYNPIVVFLHEIAHGLGMSGWYGQAGTLPGNYESNYDALIGFSAGLAYFTGADAESVYGGPVPLTTSSTTQNYYHFGNTLADINRTPTTVKDPLTLDLMNGVVFFFDYQYQISTLDLAVLRDLGFNVSSPSGLIGSLSLGQQLELIYVGYFDRSADGGGLAFWENQNATAQTNGQNASVALTNIANSFAPQAETIALYPFLGNPHPNFSDPTVQAGLTTFIENVYGSLFGHTADGGGLAYWLGQIESGAVGLGAAVLAIANGAQGADAIILQNKIAVAQDFTTLTTAANLPVNATFLAETKSIFSGVDGISVNDASVTTAEAAIAPWIASHPTGASVAVVGSSLPALHHLG